MSSVLLLVFAFFLPSVLMDKIEYIGKSVCFHGDAANWVKGMLNNKPTSEHLSQGVESSVKPAFSAQISPDTSFRKGEIFKFSKVTMNVGKMYDPKTGIALIPSDGNYVIAWHALADSGYATYPYLKVNNVIKGVAACHAPGGGSVRPACGNTAILPLKKGDKIWIEEWITGRTNAQAGFTSFSAWKL